MKRKLNISHVIGSMAALCTAVLLAGFLPETSALASETEAVAQTMDFTDVYGKVHTLAIDPLAKMHDYNSDYFYLVDQNMIYIDPWHYSFRLGVDVSYYQGDIDWESVKASGYEFVFIRVGYRGYSKTGSLVEDTKFKENLEGARAAGLDVGLYFFSQATSETEAIQEAEFVLTLLSGSVLELPIVYDPEFILDENGNKISGTRTSSLSGEQITNNTIAFCNTVEAAGYESAFYSNLLSESEVFNMSVLSGYTVWYADYNAVPQTPYDFTFWQYTDTGTVPGISTNVDLNIQMIPADPALAAMLALM